MKSGFSSSLLSASRPVDIIGESNNGLFVRATRSFSSDEQWLSNKNPLAKLTLA